jgi:hypothetical protein
VAKAGAEVLNPVTGHRIIFRKTTQGAGISAGEPLM